LKGPEKGFSYLERIAAELAAHNNSDTELLPSRPQRNGMGLCCGTTITAQSHTIENRRIYYSKPI